MLTTAVTERPTTAAKPPSTGASVLAEFTAVSCRVAPEALGCTDCGCLLETAPNPVCSRIAVVTTVTAARHLNDFIPKNPPPTVMKEHGIFQRPPDNCS